MLGSVTGLRPRPSTTYIGHGRTVFATGLDGVPRQGKEDGLWAFETRMLSVYEWTVDDAALQPAGADRLSDDEWLGYFITSVGDTRAGGDADPKAAPAEQTLELRVRRCATDGLAERVVLTNHTQRDVRFRLALRVDADFVDTQEASGERRQHGDRTTTWTDASGSAAPELELRYRAEHEYDHQGDRGIARIDRAITLRVEKADSAPSYAGGCVRFDVSLAPHGAWEASLRWTPSVEGGALEPRPPGAVAPSPELEKRKTAAFLEGSTEIATSGDDRELAGVVGGAVRCAKRDFASLRLFDRDRADGSWTFAGGWPTYVAFFGRDTLFASVQATLLSTDMLRGTLAELAATQGQRVDPWRDEEPGRMLHERHTGPLAALAYGPHGRYYGDATSSMYYGAAVAELWRWTADRSAVEPFIEPALRTLAWADASARAYGDGWYKYRTSSEDGEKNQDWKDSNDAIVYPDGSQVPAPIGTCGMQGVVYASKLRLAEVLFSLGRTAEARALYGQAVELKKRFNDEFWMEDERYFAFAVDPTGRLVRTIASDAGRCLMHGIVDDDRAPAVAARLMAPDLFSGWGIRTLSAKHPAYDPFAYHRGTVWPVENGEFATAFARYGLTEALHALTRAQFEAAALFALQRLPETFAGHTRDAAHPFPGLYPRANWPQAWSASAVFACLQALLGIVPYAPMDVLFVDPRLPDWLPEVTVDRLRVGRAVVSLRFLRQGDGSTRHEVIDRRGPVHVLAHPRPQLVLDDWGERIQASLSRLLR